jgi:cell division protein FtsQ
VLTGVAALAAGALVWAVYFSSLLDVRVVAVQGDHILQDSDIAMASGIEIGSPLARVDLRDVEKRIEQLPAVKSVEVSRSWPHTVEIRVVERQAVAAVRTGGQIWALDDSGVLFSRIAEVPNGLPEIHAGRAADQAALREGARVVAALPTRLSRKVSFVDVRSVDDISLHMRNGALVRWGNASDTHAKAEVLTLLMRSSARVYDVSSPGQPTVRP